ncbi:MAG: ribonuclease T [Halothiobacillaceae bacterium]|nr:MAG: ribonuclease T [Halothiobacillaceae bacterium]
MILADGKTPIARRFRGFLPVVVDVETGGFNAQTDALLEIAVVLVELDDKGFLHHKESHSRHVLPFPGAVLNPKALQFNGIDPYHPFRQAVLEHDALEALFRPIRKEIKSTGCTRAILVGHNPWFDLSFLNAAVERTDVKRNPFHPFSSFDTATLGGLAFGQTVLARAAMAAGIAWDNEAAHSALYDAEKTAQLFCTIVNLWQATRPMNITPVSEF